ncbi:hypothetical protein [Pseudomonas sp. KU43P]|uniref:hypothetical protein n=1 Tax=Pseudomonas sp. KU43P TaxID=2487887 RepID=UPI0012A7823A|nr:hypothetical protein [Pseudomonas sp. KU43P]BBH44420.1 hypothetical protein KU43P_08970 [Pseudomonas sp. KU43P]
MSQMEQALPATRSNRITTLIAKIMTGVGVVLGGMWAIITYLVPDPSVFGFGFINWRNIVLLVSTFLLLSSLSICWQIRNLPKMMRGTLTTALIVVLSFAFFTLGTEYAKPSFEFAKVQSTIIENDGSNLLGKRIEVVDDIRVELVECENIGRFPTCTFQLTNLGMDRSFSFNGNSRMFDEAGAPLKINQMRVGQQPNNVWNDFQLIRNVTTSVTLQFQEADRKIERSPSIKLIFRTRGNDEQALKFNDVALSNHS